MTAVEFPKVGKSITVELDGRSVELTRVPVRRYPWAYTKAHEAAGGHPMEQTLLQIRVDGDFVGLASRSHGWGSQSFRIEALWQAHRHGWPDETRFGGGFVSDLYRLQTPQAIARKAIELRDKTLFGKRRQLMTEEEIATAAESHIAEEAREAENTKRDRERWAREDQERKARATEHKNEVLAGLEILSTRRDLSNLERAALVAAIARYEADR